MTLGLLFPLPHHRAERSLVAFPFPDLFVHARELLVEANRLDATKAGTNRRPSGGFRVTLEGLLGPPVAEWPSAPALRLLEPHTLATVTNIAWLEEYDPRLLERPLHCLKRACPRFCDQVRGGRLGVVTASPG